jgi:quercetin dioxygenase-like cupin family protein
MKTMNSKKSARQNLLIDPTRADLFESPKPFRRFMKLLVDRDSFPGTPLTIAMVQYPPGAQSPVHSHKKTTEVYFVLAGVLTATIEGRRHRVKKGQFLYIPSGSEHRAKNRERKTCRFMTINTPLASDVAELKVRKEWKKVNQAR